MFIGFFFLYKNLWYACMNVLIPIEAENEGGNDTLSRLKNETRNTRDRNQHPHRLQTQHH